MSEQQQFQPGDRVKVTMELTVVDGGVIFVAEGKVNKRVLDFWSENNHVTVELIEQPEPPREPGLHLCAYDGLPIALRWDGENWHWPGQGDDHVLFQDRVAVIGSITLHEGVEL